jgi:hypothetical protein
MKWAWNIAPKDEKRNVYRLLVGKTIREETTRNSKT